MAEVETYKIADDARIRNWHTQFRSLLAADSGDQCSAKRLLNESIALAAEVDRSEVAGRVLDRAALNHLHHDDAAALEDLARAEAGFPDHRGFARSVVRAKLMRSEILLKRGQKEEAQESVVSAIRSLHGPWSGGECAAKSLQKLLTEAYALVVCVCGGVGRDEVVEHLRTLVRYHVERRDIDRRMDPGGGEAEATVAIREWLEEGRGKDRD